MFTDIRRLYYGVTAFVVFLVAFIAGEILIDELTQLAYLNAVPFAEREQPRPILVTSRPPAMSAPVTPGAAAPTPAPTPTLTREEEEALRLKEFALQEDYSLRSTKEGLAGTVAAISVALPVWWFHFRRWRTLTETQAVMLYRLYFYSLMVIALVTALIRAAGALGKILQFGLGLVPINTWNDQASLIKDLVGGILGALLAFGVWWFHRRIVENLPSNGKGTARA